MRDMILVIDFGGTRSQATARKVRSLNIYTEVLPCDAPVGEIAAKAPKGIILAGGMKDNLLPCPAEALNLGVPVLAIGVASRALINAIGGTFDSENALCDGIASVEFGQSPLFGGISASERMIEDSAHLHMPSGTRSIARKDDCIMAFEDESRRVYGMQFSAEQNDPDGLTILNNFAADICSCEAWWSMNAFIEMQLDAIRDRVGDKMALLAMSGGVDSSVCATLMHKAIGRQLTCLYVDTGLMRKGETAQVERVFREDMGMNLIVVNAADRFVGKLAGVTDPERKRKIIGEEFIRVFEEEAGKLGRIDYLVQGTIYPDIIESFGVGGTTIKAHHNVGGLPEHIDFSGIIEPVRELFKDEVRELGTALGLPESIVHRQPFPGPGLSVRCIGEVTFDKLNILRDADLIFRDEIVASGLNKKIWQYFVVLTEMRSVGIRDGARSYEYLCALRAIHSVDAMSAGAVRLPYDLLERVTARITTEVAGINRVVYDITPKPPATIEWE